MKRSNDRRTAAASSSCQDRRRERRPRWVRPFLRANEALNASARLINAGIAAAARSEGCARRRPVRSSRELWTAGRRMLTASARLNQAARAIRQTNESLAHEPETAEAAFRLTILATERWIDVAQTLSQASQEIFALHKDVMYGLALGELVPERTLGLRPPVILGPQPDPVREFLSVRPPRVADRIALVLRRRRRSHRPAALSVPPRTSQGRAPPFSSI